MHWRQYVEPVLFQHLMLKARAKLQRLWAHLSVWRFWKGSMESDSEFNRTVNTPDSNNANRDIIEQILLYAVQPSIGLAIILSNIVLLIFYKHKSQKKEITLLFLANLTGSDISLGVLIIVHRILESLIEPEYQIEVCRYVSGVALGSTIVSAWSIFLLSYQVRYT